MLNGYAALIYSLIFLDFILDTIVDRLNSKQLKADLPNVYKHEFQNLYDTQKYQTYLSYQNAHIRLNQIKRPIHLIILLSFIFLKGFNTLDQSLRALGYGEIITGLLFIGTLGLLQLLTELPFSIYQTFIIEQKYGFNKTSPGTFISDLTKGFALVILLGMPTLALLLFFFQKAGQFAWLYSWFFTTFIQVALIFLAPKFILPFFNKFDPLPEGELKQAILNYASSQNFKLTGIFQMDGSKRSTKSNAFFTGFGKFKRLVLFDTLIQKHAPDELVSILAHEIGHFKKHHILKSVLLSFICNGLLFFFLSLFLLHRALFDVFGMDSRSIYASLIFIGFLYAPVSRLLSIFSNFLSRKYEFEADRFARETYGKPEALVSALKKLTVDNLSHLTPHPLKVFIDYTHPPIIQRIEALRKQ